MNSSAVGAGEPLVGTGGNDRSPLLPSTAGAAVRAVRRQLPGAVRLRLRQAMQEFQLAAVTVKRLRH